jgi:hypothetical protein
MKKETKKIPIYAGMKFTYKNGTIDNKLHIVGYDIFEFIWTKDSQLISEKRIKRVFIN